MEQLIPSYVMPLQRCCTMQRGVPLTEDRIVISIWFGAKQTCAPPLWNRIYWYFQIRTTGKGRMHFHFGGLTRGACVSRGEAMFFHERLVALFKPQSHRVSYFCTKGVSNRIRIMGTNINSNIAILQTGHVYSSKGNAINGYQMERS